MNSGVLIIVACLFLMSFLFGFLDASIRHKIFRKKAYKIPNDCGKKNIRLFESMVLVNVNQDKTPAEIAGIKLPFKTWTEFVRQDK